MSKSESDEVGFLLFSIIIFLILLIEIKMLEMENFQYMKVFLFISAVIFTVLFFVFIAVKIFDNDYGTKVVRWVSSNDLEGGRIADSKTTVLVFGENVDKPEGSNLPKHLKMIEFYSKKLDISKLGFSKCKELEEVVFHYFPININENAFSECISLKTIYFFDNAKGKNNLLLKIPESCSIKFDTTKEVILTDEGLKISPVKIDVKVEKKQRTSPPASKAKTNPSASCTKS